MLWAPAGDTTHYRSSMSLMGPVCEQVEHARMYLLKRDACSLTRWGVLAVSANPCSPAVEACTAQYALSTYACINRLRGGGVR